MKIACAVERPKIVHEQPSYILHLFVYRKGKVIRTCVCHNSHRWTPSSHWLSFNASTHASQHRHTICCSRSQLPIGRYGISVPSQSRVWSSTPKERVLKESSEDASTRYAAVAGEYSLSITLLLLLYAPILARIGTSSPQPSYARAIGHSSLSELDEEGVSGSA